MKDFRWVLLVLLLLLPLATLAAPPGIPVLNVQSAPWGGQN